MPMSPAVEMTNVGIYNHKKIVCLTFTGELPECITKRRMVVVQGTGKIGYVFKIYYFDSRYDVVLKSVNWQKLEIVNTDKLFFYSPL